MYKVKSNHKDKGSPCSMGSLVNGFVECYWFGTVSLSECSECSVRKDNKLITKVNGML